MFAPAGNRYFQPPGKNFNHAMNRQESGQKNETTHQKFSWRKRLRSFVYAWRGIRFMAATQHNFWIHLALSILVIIAGFVFDISLTEWCLIIFAMGLVLMAETFNSALEQLTDLVHPDRDPRAGRIKDLAAGAVLLAAIASALIGLLIFAPKIFALL